MMCVGAQTLSLRTLLASMTDSCSTVSEAVILVGGLGTRLRAVVADRPKPMADVRGRPFVEWLLIKLRHEGIRRFVFSLGYRGDWVSDHFKTGADWNVEITYIQEQTPLGTGGAVQAALQQVRSQTCLVCNGDSICTASSAAAIAQHSTGKQRATLTLIRHPQPDRYGVVELDGSNVRAFIEKSESPAGPALVNAGVYLFERDALDDVTLAAPFSLERAIFPEWLDGRLAGCETEGEFLDIGTPESYTSAGRFLEHFES